MQRSTAALLALLLTVQLASCALVPATHALRLASASPPRAVTMLAKKKKKANKSAKKEQAAALESFLQTASSGPLNTALVFVKPHAATDACEAFVRQHLTAAGINILSSGVKRADEIDSKKLIDQHYGSLAQLAMSTQPADISLAASAKEAFAEAYGTEWDAALGSMLRNDDALERLGCDGLRLEEMWRGGVQCKLAPGTYVSRLDGPDEPLFTINGFYPAMRQAFVEAGAEVRYLVCGFEEARLSWADFRQKVIGSTNPADAQPGSARAEILGRWEELGLASAPTLALNGVHASAGPLEGLKERCVWSGASRESDAFAQALLRVGVGRSELDGWLRDNPVVTLGGKTDKIFDLTEELGTAAVLELCGAADAGGGAAAPADAPDAGVFEPAAPAGFEWGGSF